MSNAEIAQEGAPRELYEEPANLFVADFIGDANLVSGELSEPQGERARVRLADLEIQLRHRGAKPGPIKVALATGAAIATRTNTHTSTRPARATGLARSRRQAAAAGLWPRGARTATSSSATACVDTAISRT